MKYALAASIIAIMAFGSVPAAQADKLDFSKMTCSQFLALSKDEIGTTMIWLEGFYTTQDSPPVLDTDKITTDGTNLGTYCAKNPDSGFIDAANATVKDQN
jgi:acid stress chaperone HdeB